MTDLGSSAVRDQLAEIAARRLQDRERLAELTAAREALAVRVIELEDEVGRLRATVAAVAMPGTVLAPPVPFLPAPLPQPVLVPATVAVPVEAPALPGRPRRLRLRPTVPAVLFAIGALAVADGVTAVVWQEPVSALYGTWQQDRLGAELAELDRSESAAAPLQLSPQEEARIRRASRREAGERRMAAAAEALEGRAKPGQPLGRVRIPRLDQSLVVVEGTGSQELRSGPGRYRTGAMPGMPGTFGVAGHRTSWSAPFRQIDKMREGDRIVVTMPYGRFTYRVSTKRIVKPEDVWVLSRRQTPRIVLTACHPLFSAAKRIVVSADLVSATPRGAAAKRS